MKRQKWPYCSPKIQFSAGRTPWSFYKVGVKIGYGDILPPLSQIHSHDSAVVFGRRRRPPFVMHFLAAGGNPRCSTYSTRRPRLYFASYISWKCYDLCMAVLRFLCGHPLHAGVTCSSVHRYPGTPILMRRYDRISAMRMRPDTQVWSFIIFTAWQTTHLTRLLNFCFRPMPRTSPRRQSDELSTTQETTDMVGDLALFTEISTSLKDNCGARWGKRMAKAGQLTEARRLIGVTTPREVKHQDGFHGTWDRWTSAQGRLDDRRHGTLQELWQFPPRGPRRDRTRQRAGGDRSRQAAPGQLRARASTSANFAPETML